jgi:hypothetical protein
MDSWEQQLASEPGAWVVREPPGELVVVPGQAEPASRHSVARGAAVPLQPHPAPAAVDVHGAGGVAEAEVGVLLADAAHSRRWVRRLRRQRHAAAVQVVLGRLELLGEEGVADLVGVGGGAEGRGHGGAAAGARGRPRGGDGSSSSGQTTAAAAALAAPGGGDGGQTGRGRRRRAVRVCGRVGHAGNDR